jgi:hypothetical protein
MTNTAESTINLFARRSRVINGPSGNGCGGVYSFSSSWEDEDEDEDEDETLVRLLVDEFPLRVVKTGLLSLFLSPPPRRRNDDDSDDDGNGNVALFPIIIISSSSSLSLSLFFFARDERRDER